MEVCTEKWEPKIYDICDTKNVSSLFELYVEIQYHTIPIVIQALKAIVDM